MSLDERTIERYRWEKDRLIRLGENFRLSRAVMDCCISIV
jgi:hypothetical protein